MIFDQNRGAERSWGKIDRRRRPPSLPSKDFVLLTRASSEPFEALYSDRLLGNLYGLRTIPTGVPLYANGNPTPTTAGGNINLGAVILTGGALGSATKPGSVKYAWA